MSIHKTSDTRKTELAHDHPRWTTPTAIMVLLISLSFSSFLLGKLSAQDSTAQGIQVETPQTTVANTGITEEGRGNASKSSETGPAEQTDDVLLVGSRNSNIYHFPWCSGGQRINEENKLTFSSYAEAQEAGYRAAKNCEGLE